MQMTDATVSLRGADLVADLHNVDVLIYKSTRMRLAVGMTFSETASTRRDGTLKKLDALSRERPGAPTPTLTPRQRTRHSSRLSAHFPALCVEQLHRTGLLSVAPREFLQPIQTDLKLW
jgi:hypothetical protein